MKNIGLVCLLLVSICCGLQAKKIVEVPYFMACNTRSIEVQNKKYLTEADIKKALKAYPYYSVRRQNRSDVQLACFSNYPILSVSPIDYERTYNGSVKYVLAVNNDTVTLINNHLESNKLKMCIRDRGKTVSVGIGRFGPYVLHNKVYVSLPKTMDPFASYLKAQGRRLHLFC